MRSAKFSTDLYQRMPLFDLFRSENASWRPVCRFGRFRLDGCVLAIVCVHGDRLRVIAVCVCHGPSDDPRLLMEAKGPWATRVKRK